MLSTLGLDADRVPRHVAIIMDGNGRWAQARGLPRIWGHREGAVRVREIVTRAGDLGIEHLTLFSFSSENWKRPSEEIRQLMLLCVAYLDGEERRLADEGVRLRVIGRRAGLPTDVVEAIERVERTTAGGTRGQLNLAINYGGRAEIADAARAIAARVASGQLDPDAIDEATVADNLYTAGMPDPDLLIRTAGEMRVSNYLLWQISYAEIHVCEAPWPEFDADRFDAAIRDYAGRTRRYGLTDAQLSAADGDAGR
ncbi:MAG: polyprenyl diphosphate synthase [Planctomycetota bacterium]